MGLCYDLGSSQYNQRLVCSEQRLSIFISYVRRKFRISELRERDWRRDQHERERRLGRGHSNDPPGCRVRANFSPTTLSVAPGTTITFVDQDSVAKHNVDFSSGPSGATLPSASPNLVKGSTFQVTLTTAGTYDYHCDYHSWMVATITVT